MRRRPARQVGVRVRPPAAAAPPMLAERLGGRWRAALGACDSALLAAAGTLPPGEVRERRARLERERAQVLPLLRALARDDGASARFVHLTAPTDAFRVLGLRRGTHACVFSLDGVLAGSAALHVASWAETLDGFLAVQPERIRARLAPFDPRHDYPEHLEGRLRLDGVRAFLASRGMRLPEGTAHDAAGSATVHALAERKRAALLRRLDVHGLTAFEGARAYLELAREAGIRCAVVSASENTRRMLDLAGLADLVDVCVDGGTLADGRLRARPAPDMLLEACRLLGAAPRLTAVFETAPAALAEARGAGFGRVVAVDRAGRAPIPGVVPAVAGLDEILDRTLAG